MSSYLSNSTRCPKKKWDLLLVIVAVNPTFFWDTLYFDYDFGFDNITYTMPTWTWTGSQPEAC